jgi:hypothetical protein
VVKIAPAVSGTHRDRAKAALGKVLAVSKDKNIRKQAQDALNVIEKDEDFITAFLVSGPYTAQDKGPTELFDISFPPEQAGETGVKWRAWSGGTSHVVDLAKVIGGENRVGYVRAQLWSPKAGDATLEIGTDDGVKVWLNGEVVHSINALRGLKDGQDKVKVKMEQGWNPLLVKVTHGTVFWQVYVRVRAADGSKLEGFRFKAE